MERFKTVRALAQAIKDGKLPVDLVSPGPAAQELMITRQALHNRLTRGTLRAWRAEGVVLIDHAQVKAEAKKKRGISPGQGELLSEST